MFYPAWSMFIWAWECADKEGQGGEKYQQAFYVFEELAQTPASSSTTSLISQAVAEIHLQRYEEAQAALDQALQKEPENSDALANLVVLKTITGQDRQEALA
jgi:coatomer subunit epsilon